MLAPFVVLVLVLIRDALNHQKDAHPKASVYPGCFLMPVFTSSHRKTHAVFASSVTSTQVWAQPD